VNGNTAKALERCVAYCGATAICVMALYVDGIQAITLSIAVAAGLAGAGTYAAMKK